MPDRISARVQRLMNDRIPNKIGLRAEMEKRGLGLNASGSYVLASLDAAELKHLQAVSFGSVKWLPEEWVLVVRGTARSGVLVRFVKLSPDGRYCCFPGRFKSLSPRLLETEPITRRDFIASIAKNPTLRIKKLREAEERIGILIGPRQAKYKSLIALEGDRLIAVDIEENPPPQSSQQTTRIIEDNPAQGETARQHILALSL